MHVAESIALWGPLESTKYFLGSAAYTCGILPLRLIPRLGGVIALVEYEKVI